MSFLSNLKKTLNGRFGMNLDDELSEAEVLDMLEESGNLEEDRTDETEETESVDDQNDQNEDSQTEDEAGETEDDEEVEESDTLVNEYAIELLGEEMAEIDKRVTALESLEEKLNAVSSHVAEMKTTLNDITVEIAKSKIQKRKVVTEVSNNETGIFTARDGEESVVDISGSFMTKRFGKERRK